MIRGVKGVRFLVGVSFLFYGCHFSFDTLYEILQTITTWSTMSVKRRCWWLLAFRFLLASWRRVEMRYL